MQLLLIAGSGLGQSRCMASRANMRVFPVDSPGVIFSHIRTFQEPDVHLRVGTGSVGPVWTGTTDGVL